MDPRHFKTDYPAILAEWNHFFLRVFPLMLLSLAAGVAMAAAVIAPLCWLAWKAWQMWGPAI